MFKASSVWLQEVQEVLVAAVQRFANPVQLRNNSYLARVQAGPALLSVVLSLTCKSEPR